MRVILHGGEPLLAGATRLGEIARAAAPGHRRPSAALDLRIHTNGVRLDEELCEVFLAERVKVGISLDGDRAANDLHRRYARRAQQLRPGARARSACCASDRYRRPLRGPARARSTSATTRSPSTSAGRPRSAAPRLPAPARHLGHPAARGRRRARPYADWLTAVFERWLADDRRVPVRMFESIIRTSRGGSSLTESLGLEASDVAVIETDGTIEQADSIKVAYDGAPATGFDIFSNRSTRPPRHPAIRPRQHGIAGLCDTCRQCPVVASCGGGLYAHRYRTGSGFDNPSVYCADLEKIITHVQARIIPAQPAAGRRRESRRRAHAAVAPPAAGRPLRRARGRVRRRAIRSRS